MTNAEQQLVEFCQALIRTPSLSGQEEQVARLIQKTMLQEGFDEAVIDRYGSVLGCIRGNRPGKTVLLDGHIDTVDLSDRSLWQHDPYGAAGQSSASCWSPRRRSRSPGCKAW